ncbi:hypothetical protein NBRC110019_09640 [Neptunitalea chrysea]|uniref:Transporter n=2 Tax=Neptunitalea chrysea TaxID=1647581 RepID=A0A9W6B3U8_9FLAO|nr:hypothetical protein NBRC110019_09640 [Neptunitalea chrysea]
MYAQHGEYQWWYDQYNYSGDYTKLLPISPAYMGPNALPVPKILNGKLPEKSYIKAGSEVHFSKGDDTQNGYLEVYVPLFSKKAGLRINMVPYEHYKMDTITRDLRKAMDYDAQGTATGDVHIATNIQLLENHKFWPDVVLSINLKTASGSNLRGMRYTDTPGYSFYFSLGKTYQTNGFIESIRPHGITGLYVYQTFHTVFRQNDCLLYGIGLDTNMKKVKFTNALGGYQGYIGNDDHPMVYRATLTSTFNSRFNFDVRFQKGLRDFEYTSLRFSCIYNLSN